MPRLFLGGSNLPTRCDLEMSFTEIFSVFFENQIIDDSKYKVVSVLVLRYACYLRQFLLEHCSIPLIREWRSPSSLRRDVTSETKTPAKAFLKFSLFRIRIMACLNSFSSDEIESSWSISLLRSEDTLKLLFCLFLFHGFTSAAISEAIARCIRYIKQWAQLNTV